MNIASNQLKSMFNIKKKDTDEEEKRRRERNFKLFCSTIKREPIRIEEEKRNKIDEKMNDEENVKKRLNKKGDDGKLISSCIKEKVNQFEYDNIHKNENMYYKKW